MDPLLIVDDEKDNLDALKRLLRHQFDVTLTSSPFEALKAVQKTHFNVIISDQRMPEMSGVELLEKIKQVSPETIRILLTGYTDIDSVIGAINRGHIYQYIAKPWDPEELKLTLRQANEAYLLRRQLEEKNKQLESALAEVKLLDQAKARFLALVSHELNTPLTVLKAFVELLTDHKGGLPADMQKALGSISSASQRFSEIIDEVLTYVRIEADGVIRRASFDLRSELDVLKKALNEECEAKSVKILLGGESKSEDVQVDVEKMRLALKKILKDTLSRAVPDSEINVLIEKEPKHFCVRILRSGSPLSPDALKPLEPSADILHHGKNLGLQLATANVIIQRHGGDLVVNPVSEGASLSLFVPR